MIQFGRKKNWEDQLLEDQSRVIAPFPIGARVRPPFFFGAHSIEESNLSGDPFATDEWQDHCRSLARRAGIASAAYLGNPETPVWRLAARQVLRLACRPSTVARAAIAGSICSRHLLHVAALIRDIYLRRGSVSVLDVGGGFGDNFFELLQVMPRAALAGLRYTVVDNKESCALGESLFRRYRVRPRFVHELHSVPTHDIALLIGTLQYMSPWRDALTAVAAKAGEYLFLARSPITPRAESFCTTQMVCPVYGNSAGRYIGPASVAVISTNQLHNALPHMLLCVDVKDTDYSSAFAKLPAENREAAYYCMIWRRVSAAS